MWLIQRSIFDVSGYAHAYIYQEPADKLCGKTIELCVKTSEDLSVSLVVDIVIA